MKKTPYKHQEEAYQALAESLNQGLKPYANMSTGCHSHDYKIKMSNGSVKNVKKIRIGDKLRGKNWNTVTVISKHSGYGAMFNIIPEGMESFKVNLGHIMHLYDFVNNDFINISVESFLKLDNQEEYQLVYDLPYRTEYIDFLIIRVSDEKYYGFETDGDHLYLGRDYVVHHNSGKSLVCSMFAEKIEQTNRRMLITVPSSELVEQNYNEIKEQGINNIGICCSKLSKFNIDNQIVIATPLSFKNKMGRLKKSFNLLMCDEAHTVSPKINSTYQKILRYLWRINSSMKIAGLTASPWREYGPLHEETLEGPPTFTNCCYETDIAELINQGILSSVITLNTDIKINLDGIRMSGSEFNTSDVGVKFHEISRFAVDDMRLKFAEHNIRTAIIFTSTIKNAEEIYELWPNKDEIKVVTGKTTKQQRNSILEWLKNGQGNRYVANVGILTTGFDYKQLECVVMCRATTSRVVYVQTIGRCIRSHQEKDHAYYIDYGSNIERLGPIDKLKQMKVKKEKSDPPVKVCLNCAKLNRLSAKICIDCGYYFISDDETGKYKMYSGSEVLSMKEEEKRKKNEAKSLQQHEIKEVVYNEMTSRSGVQIIEMIFFNHSGSRVHHHYLCLEHNGVTQQIAKSFFRNLFTDESNYYKLCAEGLTCKIAVGLLRDYPQFFKKIIGIETIKKQDSRFRDIKSIIFGD